MDKADKLRTGQYLTFKLNSETFGGDVTEILEILEYVEITKIPQTPDYMCGVLNLRGKAIPVIDMRKKLGIEQCEVTVYTSIILISVDIKGQATTLGALVDSVCEVLEIEDCDMEPAPNLGTDLHIDFVKGMYKKDNKFIILLNMKKIFFNEELLEIKQFGDE